MKIENPLVIVYEQDRNTVTRLYPGSWGYREYGILIGDLVRHVANAFKTDENNVWEWVDKERYHQTSPVTELKPN